MPVPARVVHVVAKTHLDLGFTGLAAEVVERYVDDFFPRAVAVADELRRRGGTERLVWTTGSWILHHALELGPPGRPDRPGRLDGAGRLGAAVAAGDLAWHALPVTTHTELMDADLVRSGLGISAELDARFGRATTAAKLNDVPGHTRGLVPLLAEAGVTFLHVGVNPAWPVPDVPPVFRWRSPDGTEVVVAYQAGGYGGEVLVPGCDEVLAFLHSGDNLGPPTVEEVLAAHADLRARYPETEVRASTLDAFARAVAASGAAAGLPLVTAEIGDPWLFGAASDPQKVAAYRHLLRVRTLVRERLEVDGGVPVDPATSPSTSAPWSPPVAPPASVPASLAEVDRTLLLVAEHTWGLDQKEALPDTTHWNRPGLAHLRRTAEGVRFEASWAEQRAHVDHAAALLHGAWSGGAAEPAGVVALERSIFAPPMGADGRPVGGEAGFTPVTPGEWLDGGAWRVTIDAVDGSVRGLVETVTGRVLADGHHPLGLLRYQSFDAADYERFHAGLTPLPADEWWARWDNTKAGIDAVPEARSGLWAPMAVDAWHGTHQGGAWHDLLVRVGFTADLTDRLGAPPEAWIRWYWSHDADPSGRNGLEVSLWWADKPANRLPEAMWCSLVPRVAEPDRWVMDKLGQAVPPLDVVRHGGRSLHGVGEGGLRYDGPDGPLRLTTPDAPLVAPGRPNLLDADPPLPDLAGGWHVLLHDNCWGTNFPMWNEGPARFRFGLSTG